MATGFINLGNMGGVRDLTATSNDVRSGKTFSVNGKDIITGSMDLSKLTPDNIKKGVNIAGVIGNVEGPLIKYVLSKSPRVLKNIDINIRNYIPQIYDEISFKASGKVEIEAGIYFHGAGKVANGDNGFRIKINDKVLFYSGLKEDTVGGNHYYRTSSYKFIVKVSEGDIIRTEFVGTGGLCTEDRRGGLWINVYYNLEFSNPTQDDYDRLKPV